MRVGVSVCERERERERERDVLLELAIGREAKRPADNFPLKIYSPLKYVP